MLDLELRRGTRPSYRPALERLEGRLLLTTYTNLAFTDCDGNAQTLPGTITWSAGDPTYDNALAALGNATNAFQGEYAALGALSGTWDNTTQTWSGSAADELFAMDPWSVEDGVFNGITNLTNVSTFEYKVDTSGVTIDASVTDAPSAKVRAEWLIADCRQNCFDQTNRIHDIQTKSSALDRVACTVWYSGEIQTRSNLIRRELAELQLIKQKYPCLFRNP